MQVTELESNGLKKKYKITVDAATINAQTEAELRAAGEKVKIPGFRPGYIPMKILQQRYGKSVKEDVLKQVINQASGDVLAERKLRPTLQPQVNIEEYKEDGDLVFSMSLETFPDLPEISFDNITLNRKTFDIDESAVDTAVARVAERSPQFSRVEGGKAESGNVVVIDFKGTIDGVPFDGGAAQDFRLTLGSGQFIDGFEDQLIGAKEGEERMVKVAFPKEYAGKEVAGKDAAFKVKVKEIQRAETPVVDEEFAKARGFSDLAALREAVRTQLKREYDQIVRNQLKKELFDILEEKNDFPLPEGMVELEFNTIWERLQQAKAQGDESVAGKSEEELKTEYKQIANRRVKLGLLLAETGNRHKIQISRDELGRAVMQQAGQFPGQEKQVMDFYRSHPERVDDLRGPILEEKAVDFILSKVKFNDEKVALDALIAEDEEDEAAPKKTKAAKKTAKSDEEKGEKKPTAKPSKKKAAEE